MRFKIGDKVKNIINNAGKKYNYLVGEIGIVIDIEGEDIFVLFEQFKTQFHTGEFSFYSDELCLVSE